MTTRNTPQQPDVFRFVSGVSYSARTSQETIKGFATLTAQYLRKRNEQFAEAVSQGETVLARILQSDHSFSAEMEEEITSNLLAAEHSLAQGLDDLREKEHSAVCDHDLYGRNEEIVTEGYQRAIELTITLAKVTQKIRWAIMERAEDYSEKEGKPMTPEELLAELD